LVNSPDSYFNITGNLKFKGIKFSGVNALAVRNAKNPEIISHLPMIYCSGGTIGRNLEDYELSMVRNCMKNFDF
jgi:hypothetical protein